MNLLANMKIGRRLSLGFAVILALCVVITTLGIWKQAQIGDATDRMMDLPLKKERLSSDWSRNITSAVVRTTAVAKSSDVTLSGFFKEDAAASSKSSSNILEKLEPLLVTAEEKALYAKIVENRKAYIATRDNVFRLKAEGQAEEANKALETGYLPAAQAYQVMVAEFLDMQRKNLDMENAGIDEIQANSRTQLLVLAGLVIAFGIFCSWSLTVGITRPLSNAVTASRRVADGDLSGEIVVSSKDETGELLQALKDMNGNLLKIVSEVRTGTDTIATASSQIAAGNLDLSSRTEQQASSLEETASSMEELTSTVKQNADNARQANQLAISATEVAAKGGHVVDQVVQTMESINGSSKKIVDIISVIDGIAFQTNILALNAAVEAARAGEQGRGFAVVASEVRALAQRSASAAKEIKGLIDDSVSKVDGGTKLVAEAGQTMGEVVSSIQRVTDIMGEIMSASQEQTSGIEQINQAISQMDQVTQQNASLVEEAAAASEAMQDQAAKLAQAVSVFKLSGAHSVSAIANIPARSKRTAPVRKATRTIAAPTPPKAAPVITASNDWEEF